MTRPASVDWDDEFFLTEIENAVADGADSCPKIAKAVGVSESALRSRMFLRKNASEKLKASFAAITTAIKKGKALRRSSIKAAASDGLLRLVSGYTYRWKESEYRFVQDPKHPDDPTKRIKIKVEEKTKAKHFEPNSTAVIFALCNMDPERFKSILRAGAEGGEDKSQGLVVDWMRQQMNTGKKFTKADFPGIDDDPDGGGS